MADDVVEIGPGGGSAGGRLVFQGTPAALWRADTASGRGFSATTRARRARRPARRRADPHHRRQPAQPARRRLRDPAGIAHGDHRSVRARARPRWRATCCWRRCASTSPIGCAAFDAPADARHRGRPGAAGQQPAVEPGHLHQGVRPHPRRVRRRDGTVARRSSRSTEPKARARSAKGWGRSSSASATSRPCGSRARRARAGATARRSSTRRGRACRSPTCWRAASTTPAPCSPSTAP